VGKVIVVGAEDPEVARTLGWETAATMNVALEMAETHVGRKPTITLMHVPPIGMVDVTA